MGIDFTPLLFAGVIIGIVLGGAATWLAMVLL
jgi:hypothetical protein